ncbi:MAG: ABC transporter permease [Proteobacteria bacterium]|nr:ABC transporter permease [Pseudomonadota bacterium]
MGVASLLVVISISSGFQDEFTKKVLGVNSHVLVMKYGIDFTEYREVMSKAEQMPEVRGVAPFVIQEMMISKGERTASVLLKGVDPDRLGDVLDLPNHIVKGGLDGLRIPGSGPPGRNRAKTVIEQVDEAFEPPPGKTDSPPAERPVPGIVLGSTLAENLEAGVGDQIQVTTPLIGLDVLGWAPTESTPRTLAFKVVGIFYAGFLEYDTKLAYVDYYQAQRFFEHGDSVTGVEATLHDIHAARSVSKRLKEVLGPGPYHMIDWEMLNEPLFTALMMQKVVLTLVLAVIVGVAAFNIIATLVMMVFDKRREIAILKSMGATHIGIARIFLYVGTVVGLVGTAIGLTIGFGVCIFLREIGWPLDPKVYLIDHLPVRLEVIDFVITAVVAFLICLLATILPSLSASRLRPVDGIRQE